MTRAKKISAGVAAAAVVAGALLISPPAPPVTYAVVTWTVKSNGVRVLNVPSVVSYSTNLRDWQRVATNTNGSVTVATDAAANFFKVGPL